MSQKLLDLHRKAVSDYLGKHDLSKLRDVYLQKSSSNVPSCLKNPQKRFTALYHQTSVGNAIRILKSGRFLTRYELWKLGQKVDGVLSSSGDGPTWMAAGEYVGIYFRLGTSNDAGHEIDDHERSNHPLDHSGLVDAPVVFVMSTALLEQNNYHLNEEDSQGAVTHRSYGPNNISKFPKNPKQTLPFPVPNEIIFHDTVSLDFLEEIWVYNTADNEFSELLDNEGLDRYFPMIKNIPNDISTYPTIPYTKLCSMTREQLDQKLNKSLPNYCSVMPYDPEIESDIKGRQVTSLANYKKIAKNCGMTDAEISQFTDQSELRNYLIDHDYLVKAISERDSLPQPQFEPPFS